jgi:transposase
VWYAESGSLVVVQRRFRALFGRNATAPSRSSIKKWYRVFLATGSVNRKKRLNIKFVCNEEMMKDVIQVFRNVPFMSVRRAANLDGMPSATTIHRILKGTHFHPYKLQLIHQLRPQDHQKRIVHSQTQLAAIRDNPHFLKLLIFSDEAHFHVHGVVNKQDFRYWSETNPIWFQEQPLHSPRVTVWAAIGWQGVFGPFFFEENINGANYLDMLQHRFLPAAQTMPCFGAIIFMQDGAPPHWSLAVRNFLSQTFPNRWMGRGSSNYPWPPYSPDLTPMDFFLWGYIKSRVYTTPVGSVAELRLRISQAFENLHLELVKHAIQSYERRLHLCLERGGESVEMRM